MFSNLYDRGISLGVRWAALRPRSAYAIRVTVTSNRHLLHQGAAQYESSRLTEDGYSVLWRRSASYGFSNNRRMGAVMAGGAVSAILGVRRALRIMNVPDTNRQTDTVSSC